MENTQEIKDILKAAQTNLEQLNEQKELIFKATEQIEKSAISTINDVDRVFDDLQNQLQLILDAKRKKLRVLTHLMKEESLKPLNQCKSVIDNEILKMQKYIKDGKDILSNDNKNSHATKFKEGASFIGSLPAVPTIEEVPYITFEMNPNNIIEELERRIDNFGRVSKMGPIQIVGSYEKPGAVLIQWEDLEVEDRNADIQVYRLQRTFGNVLKNASLYENFQDCYLGSNVEYLSRDMVPNETYSFRVCCQNEYNNSWSAWSNPHITKTKLLPFMWQDNANGFKLLKGGKLITKISSGPAIIYSKDAQVGSGHSVEFTFLECGESNELQGIGLVDSIDKSDLNLIRPGSFMLATSGQIYIDGQEKLTQLPKITQKSKVTFSCEKVSQDKVRINIDSENKSVTYDWIVDTDLQLYFAAFLTGTDWKILVE